MKLCHFYRTAQCSSKKFHDIIIIFHDFPDLENGLPKFHDFPWPGGTLGQKGKGGGGGGVEYNTE